MYEIEGKYTTAVVMTDEHSIDPKVFEQILGFINHPAFPNPIRIMPDYHYGKGAVIGFTMPLADKVIPNVIGVDISCNMLHVNFGKLMEFSQEEWLAIDRRIRKLIPMAYKHHEKPVVNIEGPLLWTHANTQGELFTTALRNRFGTQTPAAPSYSSKWFFDLCEKVGCKPKTTVNSIGTLGGGNHFIEFGLSKETHNTGLTLHSGSRNLGARVCNYWQKVAKSRLKEWNEGKFPQIIADIKSSYPKEEWDKRIKDAKKPAGTFLPGLEALEGDDMFGYLYDMMFCHAYARFNIFTMMSLILKMLNLPPTLGAEAIHTIHNFIDPEDLIIRKGAVKSMKGDKMIIPFNMEDGLLICEGKSNPDWNFSAPHGGGRIYGRKDIKRKVKAGKISKEETSSRMKAKGIHCRVLPTDEMKEAYKPMEFIEKAITPTATIVDRVTPILPIKADD